MKTFSILGLKRCTWLLKEALSGSNTKLYTVPQLHKMHNAELFIIVLFRISRSVVYNIDIKNKKTSVILVCDSAKQFQIPQDWFQM